MKYIKTVLDRNSFVLFPDLINHSEMAARLSLSKGDVLSAGFVQLTVDENNNPTFKCHGKSISLGLQSLPTDSEELNRQMFPDSWMYN